MRLIVNRVSDRLSIVNVEANGRSEGTHVLDTANMTKPVPLDQWIDAMGGITPLPPNPQPRPRRHRGSH